MKFILELVTEKQPEAKKTTDEILNAEKKAKEEEPILNKQILQALTNHAQSMAKIALESHGSGLDLVKDIKVNNLNDLKSRVLLNRVIKLHINTYILMTERM